VIARGGHVGVVECIAGAGPVERLDVFLMVAANPGEAPVGWVGSARVRDKADVRPSLLEFLCRMSVATA
jgi:hypothetical protein